MSWLIINPNTRVNLKLLEGVIHERKSHWVDRSSKDCSGNGCIYCAAGSKPKSRFYLAVNDGQTDNTWEFPASVRDQLVNILGGPDKIAGASVTVYRAGEGLQTRYSVESAAAASVQKSVPAGSSWKAEVRAIVRDELRDASWLDAVCHLLVDTMRAPVETESIEQNAEDYVPEEDLPY